MRAVLWMTFLGLLRDRILQALFGVAGLMLLLVPIASQFSMRQVEELSITLSLSAVSLTLLLLAVLLGATSVWRDIEQRYTATLLGLPLARHSYLLGRFAGLSLFLTLACALLTLAALAVIAAMSTQPPAWGTILLACLFSGLKFILLAAFAMFFSSLSTSLFLPIFGTLGVYFAGSASQEVFEYVSGDMGANLPVFVQTTSKVLYYLLPNYAAFDLKVHATYNLPVDPGMLVNVFAYFIVSLAVLLTVTSWIFKRRDLP
jgi:Cu-processing system permease protein